MLGESSVGLRTSSLLLGITLVVLVAGCSGGGSPFSPAPAPQPVGTSAPAPVTGTPAPPATSAAFNDWTTYGYDNAHDGFNPNSQAFTVANLKALHLAWSSSLNNFNTGTEPIVATGVAGHAAILIVGGGSGTEYAYDATTGTNVWSRDLGQENYTCGGSSTAIFGIGGTAAYDKATGSIFVVDGKNNVTNGPAHVSLFRLNAGTGTIASQVEIAPSPLAGELNFGHSGVTFANGLAYVGTSSTCDVSSWKGRIAAVNTSTMTLARTFFPAYDPNGNTYSGGGVWSWGGVAVDGGGDVYAGIGNADTGNAQAPGFTIAPSSSAAYGEHFLRLSNDLATLRANNYPIAPSPVTDVDLSGTPVLFQPVGCSLRAAVQGKSGSVYLYDTGSIANGPLGSFPLAPPSDAGVNESNPSYSPITGLLYAGVASPSLYSQGMVAISTASCGAPSIAWRATFGDDSLASGHPRSAPTVTAGGVVFIGTPTAGDGGQLWALDATSGTILNNGAPLLTTVGHIRMAPVVDGSWLWVMDNSGHLYGLTLDTHFRAIQSAHRLSSGRSSTRFPH